LTDWPLIALGFVPLGVVAMWIAVMMGDK